MTRLTKDYRNEIREAALKISAPQKILDALQEEIDEFGERCRIEALGGPKVEKELVRDFKAINKTLDKYYGTGAQATLSVHSRQYSRLDMYLQGARWNGLVALFPDVRFAPSELNVTQLGESFDTEFRTLKSRHEEAVQQLKKLRQDLEALLNSVSTVKRLLEVWPECAELLPANDIPMTVPAITVKSINSTVGLPSGVAA